MGAHLLPTCRQPYCTPHPWVLQRPPWAEHWSCTSHLVCRQKQEDLAPSRGAVTEEVGSSHSVRP